MNNQTTIEKMKSMRLNGMAQIFYDHSSNKMYSDFTQDQFIALLVDQEWESRKNRKITNLIRTSGLRAQADIKNIDYTANRGLDKNTFDRLASLDFIDKHENIIFTGPTGTGKSYLAQAIGYHACTREFKTKYYATSRLFDEINLSKIQGTYHKLIKSIQRADLLILDDFGLTPIDTNGRQALMDIVEYKYDNASIILTSQIPIPNWHDLIGEGTIADAIIDRLIHSSHRIELKGKSLRCKKKQSLEA